MTVMAAVKPSHFLWRTDNARVRPAHDEYDG
jgi:hypothetical protein